MIPKFGYTHRLFIRASCVRIRALLGYCEGLVSPQHEVACTWTYDWLPNNGLILHRRWCFCPQDLIDKRRPTPGGVSQLKRESTIRGYHEPEESDGPGILLPAQKSWSWPRKSQDRHPYMDWDQFNVYETLYGLYNTAPVNHTMLKLVNVDNNSTFDPLQHSNAIIKVVFLFQWW